MQNEIRPALILMNRNLLMDFKMNFLRDSNTLLNCKFNVSYQNVTFYVDNQVPFRKMNEKDKVSLQTLDKSKDRMVN